MDKEKLKKRVVEVCLEMLENSAKTVRSTIEELIESANEYEGDREMFDPFKENMMKKKDLQLEQLNKYNDDIKLLKKVNLFRISDKVEFGSIVITEKQKMFIAIALGKIQVDGETFYAISTQVPVFKAMKDLRVGNAFTINNNKFTIKDIF